MYLNDPGHPVLHGPDPIAPQTSQCTPNYSSRYADSPALNCEPRDQSGTGRSSEAQTVNLMMPEERRQQLLGGASGSPSMDGVTLHTMRLVIRNLKAWPRLMAVHGTRLLPPIIHSAQFLDGDMPVPLANCFTVVKMWADHAPSSATLVHDTVLGEIRRLLRDVGHQSTGPSSHMLTGG